VAYDGKRDRAFWLHVQADLADRTSADLFLAGPTVNVDPRRSDRLNSRSIRETNAPARGPAIGLTVMVPEAAARCRALVDWGEETLSTQLEQRPGPP
jgi:hypothetical protein